MRASADLVVVGLLAWLFQFLFSDGAQPSIIGLPIGLVPGTIGAVLIAVGLLLGLIVGNALYRGAVLLALLGTALAVYGVTFFTIGGPGPRPAISDNEIGLWGGLVLWLGALIVGAQALRDPARVSA
jgi:hypothetical protein